MVRNYVKLLLLLLMATGAAGCLSNGASGESSRAEPGSARGVSHETAEDKRETGGEALRGTKVTTGPGILIVDADGAFFCAGGVYPSLPPTCGNRSLEVVDPNLSGLEPTGTDGTTSWYEPVRLSGYRVVMIERAAVTPVRATRAASRRRGPPLVVQNQRVRPRSYVFGRLQAGLVAQALDFEFV